MRNLIITASLALTLALAPAWAPAAAPANPGVKKSTVRAKAKTTARTPANARGAYRVVSIECRGEDNSQTGFGLAHLTADPRDTNVGTFGATLYVRIAHNQVQQKALQGSYTVVPGGYVLRSQWPSPEYHFLNLHRADRTTFPGTPGRHACVALGHLDQE